MSGAPWMEGLLSDTREVVRRLWEEPVCDVETLRAAIHAHRQAILGASAADQELGLLLAQRTEALLEEASTPERHRLVQIAVRYFAMDEDGDDDLASAFGFDDDVEVFNAVAGALGREDLLITLD